MIVNTCPSCGKVPTKIQTKWGEKFICYSCNLWAWGNAPLVDAATHEARINAHTIFDKLWNQKYMTRSDAYKSLSNFLRIPQRETHIKLFDRATALKTIIFAEKFLAKQRAKETV